MRKKLQPVPIFIGAALTLLAVASLLLILLPQNRAAGYTADIYQSGELLTSIDLSAVSQPYTFTVTGENGCTNKIEVRPDQIGILSADCPDKLCVHQGFISDSRLPITCLPNRLVIQLRPTAGQESSITVDINTY
mgnify:FL=1